MLYQLIFQYYIQHHHQQQQQAQNGTSGTPMGPAGVINSGASGGAIGQGGGGGAGGTPSENETNNIIHKLMCHRQVPFDFPFLVIFFLYLGRRRRIVCKTGN